MIKPLRDLLYIIPLEDRETRGSIIVPETYKQKVDQGIVKYRGPLTKGEVKRGDHVLFSSWDGDLVAVEGEGFLYVMPEDAIDGVITDDEPVMLFTKNDLDKMVMDARLQTEVKFESMAAVLSYFEECLNHQIDNHFTKNLVF